MKKKRQQVQKPTSSRPSVDAEEDNSEQYLVYRNLKKKQINRILKKKNHANQKKLLVSYACYWFPKMVDPPILFSDCHSYVDLCV